MQSIERREKETSEIKLRESADRVKRGQCALIHNMKLCHAKNLKFCIRSRLIDNKKGRI